jgi:hypothetical protein
MRRAPGRWGVRRAPGRWGMGRALAGLVAAVALAACGSQALSPVDIAQNYVYAISEGNYAGACALLEPQTRAALLTSAHWSRGCASLFGRCLPNEAQIAAADQSQLLYANVDLTTSGDRARAALSGTRVARGVRVVTLAHRHDEWRLTSPGHALQRCVPRLRRAHASRRRRRG